MRGSFQGLVVTRSPFTHSKVARPYPFEKRELPERGERIASQAARTAGPTPGSVRVVDAAIMK
jgi:hypothetical protein